MSEQFLVKQNAFLICSWRFLISSKLEQLEFKLEKLLVLQPLRANSKRTFQCTPPIAETLCVKNPRAIVVCGFLMKSL